MKKGFALTVCLCLIVSFAGCSSVTKETEEGIKPTFAADVQSTIMPSHELVKVNETSEKISKQSSEEETIVTSVHESIRARYERIKINRNRALK